VLVNLLVRHGCGPLRLLLFSGSDRADGALESYVLDVRVSSNVDPGKVTRPGQAGWQSRETERGRGRSLAGQRRRWSIRCGDITAAEARWWLSRLTTSRFVATLSRYQLAGLQWEAQSYGARW